MRRLSPHILLLLLMTALLGCRSEIPCESSQNCPADSACVDKVCKKRACISSADCAIEQFCDVVSGQCAPGCLEDSDCYYGSSCSGGACQTSGCRSTDLDCDAGQYCDASTGTCFDAPGPYCRPCTTNADCGGGGNLCVYVGGTGPWCAPECNADLSCPAGYDCTDFTSSGDVVSYHCVTLCHLLPARTAARQTPAGAARPARAGH